MFFSSVCLSVCDGNWINSDKIEFKLLPDDLSKHMSDHERGPPSV